MSVAELKPVDEGRWRLSGSVDFDTVPTIWEQLQPLVSVPGELVVSLDGVERINSAGLGLFLEGMAVARGAGCKLRLTDVPAGMKDLAALSNIETLLGLRAQE